MDILRSLPIGLYLEQPITWLHRLDPRIKLFGLLTVLLSPIQANAFWRIAIAVLLIILTFASRIPMRIWKQQMGILLLLAFMTLAIATISPDGFNTTVQPRRPIPEITVNADKPIIARMYNEHIAARLKARRQECGVVRRKVNGPQKSTVVGVKDAVANDQRARKGTRRHFKNTRRVKNVYTGAIIKPVKEGCPELGQPICIRPPIRR